jgi:hypothetical protein
MERGDPKIVTHHDSMQNAYDMKIEVISGAVK